MRQSHATTTLVTLVALGFFLTACRAPVDDAYARWATMPYAGTPTDLLGEGDRFEIRVYQEPDMSAQHVVPRSGSIQFPLIGLVRVLGRGCDEIESEVSARLAEGYLRNPSVSCQILEVSSLSFVVSGEVASAGVYPYRADMTIVQAIAMAQGLTANAANDRVIVTRVIDGVTREIVVPFQQVVNGRAPNFVLWPNDSIFVPSFRLIP